MIRLCMGSRVIVDRDPRPPLREGYMRTWGEEGEAEDGGRSPAWSGGTTQSYHHCWVGAS
jgi:hypothetical protein